MTSDLLRPKWLVSHVLVIALAVGFILLGTWQLDRHRERIESNQRIASRMEEPAQPLEALLQEAGDDLESIEYRHATVTGRFRPDDEVLMRSQVHLGAPGFHLVTPLELSDGRGVLVNRGWVPIIYDTVPVGEASPDPGESSVEGWVRLSQVRPPFGPSEPETGRLIVASRVDIARLQTQVDLPLVPVYLVMTGGGQGLPEQIRPPTHADNGPHLAYAIQWFGFATVGLVGYVFLIRRRLSRGSPRD